MYSRSPAAYEALRNFKLLQLPCVRTLKFYIDANLESAGDSLERLQQSRKQYCALIEDKKKAFEEHKRALAEKKKDNVGESSNEGIPTLLFMFYLHYITQMRYKHIYRLERVP